MIAYLISAVLAWSGLFHPIHVSVTDIEYDEERKALEIVSHVFIDDVEKHIRSLKNQPYLDITTPGNGKTLDDLIEEYLHKYLTFEINEKETTYTYLGHEVEAGALYVYMEIDKVKKLKSIKVANTVLLDYYDDQVNLVHVKVAGTIRSMKLEPGHREDVLDYQGD